MSSDRGSTTIVHRLRAHAQADPDRPAHLFLLERQSTVPVTRGWLDQRARDVSAVLREHTHAGARALLLYPPGREFLEGFLGCLYARVVAVPLPEPAKRTLDRIGAVHDDCGATIVLTTESLLERRASIVSMAPQLARSRWIATDRLPRQSDGEGGDGGEPAPDDVAFLQYTSGSTADPRGVIVRHGNLAANLQAQQAAFQLTDESVFVTWLPPFHDMGLVGALLYPMYVGIPIVQMSPAAFLRRPVSWLEAISRHHGTISAAPDSAYDLCVRRISPEQREALDLRTWRVAVNGAEPVRHATLERFSLAFASSGFRATAFCPSYGLAESVLLVTWTAPADLPLTVVADVEGLARGRFESPRREENARRLTSSGQIALGSTARIVDPQSFTEVGTNEIGEIWVSGPSVAAGYWNRPADRTFAGRLAGSTEGPFLRTGDLGFFDTAGQLFVTSRLKDLIIVDGANHYPQDIERTIEGCDPALRQGAAAAFLLEGELGEGLCVVQEVERTARRAPDVNAILRAATRAIAESHELALARLVLIAPGTLLRTTSGKVRRTACRDALLSGQLQIIADVTQGRRDKRPFAPTNVTTTASDHFAGPQPYGRETIQRFLVARVAALLHKEAGDVDVGTPLAEYGLVSKDAVGLAGELEQALDRELSPALLYEYPTIDSLARHLSGIATPVRSIGWLAPGSDMEPIAVIGMACRFPGGADDPAAFWRLLCEGRDAVTEIPASRWGLGDSHDPNPDSPGKSISRFGAFLPDVAGFDPYFFGISPREAANMDPQQRLVMEVAHEALDDAGQPRGRIAGSRTAVFVGLAAGEYSWLTVGSPELANSYTATGNFGALAANRISYHYDFRGPSFTVDSVCSSSLVGVHLACQSLRSGECTMALAGGAVLLLGPHGNLWFSKLGVLSPQGRCRAFDAAGDGIVLGEGAGVVVLKRLSRAVADGDPIHAVIRGSAVAQDGRSNGLTAPRPEAQEAMLREAYARARIEPRQIQYVETHGTGTVLGDPIEARALGAVFAGEAAASPCRIGSVKTNLGHLSIAGGIAGLIKVVLALRHRQLPASLHFEVPNPYIPFDQWGLEMQTELTAWPRPAEPLMAGVTSLSFGGTNAHVVLAEAPREDARERPTTEGPDPQPREVPNAIERPHLLAISAKGTQALKDLARRYRDLDPATLLPSHAGHSGPLDWRDVCYTAALRRDHYEARLSMVFRSEEQLRDGLDAFSGSEQRPGLSVETAVDLQRTPRVVFVFPGQGSQWFGMGRQLYDHEPAFREAIDACDRAIVAVGGPPVRQGLLAAEPPMAFEEIDVIQPALFAMEVALTALWRSWGVVADAVVGHSMGEVAAAHVAGALSLEQAALVICTRSRLLKRLAGRGAMAIVEMAADGVEAMIGEFSDRVSVAAINDPRTTVLAGVPDSLDRVLDRLRARDTYCRMVKVDVAAHSPQVEALMPELRDRLAALAPSRPTVPFFSTVTGDQVADGELIADYWADNLRRTVLFGPAVERLVHDQYDLFVEVSPHPILLHSVQEATAAAGHCLAVASCRREQDEQASMLSALGTLYTRGYPIAWERLYPAGGQVVTLPAYPWQREHLWLEQPKPGAIANRRRSGMAALSDDPIEVASEPGTRLWNVAIDTRQLARLHPHRFAGAVLLPAAAYLDLALRGSACLPGAADEDACVVEALRIDRSLLLLDGETVSCQCQFSSKGSAAAAVFRFFSRSERGSWIQHAEGKVQRGKVKTAEPWTSPTRIRARCTEPISALQFKDLLKASGVDPSQGDSLIEEAWRGEGESLARFALGAEAVADGTWLGLIDALLHVFVSIPAPEASGGVVRLIAGVRRVALHARPIQGVALFGHAVLSTEVQEDEPGRPATLHSRAAQGDVRLLDESGRVLLEIEGVRLLFLDYNADAIGDPRVAASVYELRWQESPPGPAIARQPSPSDGCDPCWLLFSDKSGTGDALRARLRARGDRCLAVVHGDSFEQLDEDTYQVSATDRDAIARLLEAVSARDHLRFEHAIHLWNLDSDGVRTDQPLELQRAQDAGCLSVVDLVRWLAARSDTRPPLLWIGTRGGQAIGPSSSVALAQTPVWGLGRVLAEEHHELWGGLIDLDPADAAEQSARYLLEQIADSDPRGASERSVFANREDQVAYRSGTRHVARLIPWEDRRDAGPSGDRARRLRPDASYLVTGGLGGLGIEVARWMIERGARRVVLLGRTRLPPRETWSSLDVDAPAREKVQAILALESMGAAVEPVSVDVSDAAALAELFATRRNEARPPIRGVIHAAGVVADGLATRLDRASLHEVLRPKLAALNLDRLLEQEPIDFFILFSSIGSLVGLPGQAAYAAANAFLDGLAVARKARGVPALSINWGGFAGAGLARTAGGRRAGEHLTRIGLPPLDPASTIGLLDGLLDNGHDRPAQLAVFALDPARHRDSATLRSSSVLRDLVRSPEQPGARSETTTIAARLSGMHADERRGALEHHVRTVLGAVLEMSPDRLDARRPLASYGIDSRMSIELRNRLESSLQLSLSATLAWNYPTLDELTLHLLRSMNLAPVPADGGRAIQPVRLSGNAGGLLARTLARVEGLSDEEISQALDGGR